MEMKVKVKDLTVGELKTLISDIRYNQSGEKGWIRE